MLALRRIAAMTTELCVLETQVVDEVEGTASGATASGRGRTRGFWR